MPAAKKRHGGRRAGAGRPPGTGGPPELVRRNRVTITLTDAELEVLRAMARDRGLPVGTTLYQLVRRRLRR